MWPQLTVGGELGPARAAPNTVRWSSPTLDENRIARVLFPAYGNRDSGSRSELRWEKDCIAGANLGQAYVRVAAMSAKCEQHPALRRLAGQQRIATRQRPASPRCRLLL